MTIAASGQQTEPYMKKFGVAMRWPDMWKFWPEEMKHHDLSCAAYRSCAGGAAATWVLIHRAFMSINYQGFLMVDGSTGMSEQNPIATMLITTYQKKSCLLDPWWFEHI